MANDMDVYLDVFTDISKGVSFDIIDLLTRPIYGSTEF